MNLKDLFSHPARGWYSLPKQPREVVQSNEQPLGHLASSVKNLWNVMTSGNGHASPLYYWMIGVALAVVTLLEVWLFGVPIMRGWFITFMVGLSLVKFALVIFFFMHLRFDNPQYRFVFAFCMFIGVAVYIALLFLTGFRGS